MQRDEEKTQRNDKKNIKKKTTQKKKLKTHVKNRCNTKSIYWNAPLCGAMICTDSSQGHTTARTAARDVDTAVRVAADEDAAAGAGEGEGEGVDANNDENRDGEWVELLNEEGGNGRGWVAAPRAAARSIENTPVASSMGDANAKDDVATPMLCSSAC